MATATETAREVAEFEVVVRGTGEEGVDVLDQGKPSGPPAKVRMNGKGLEIGADGQWFAIEGNVALEFRRAYEAKELEKLTMRWAQYAPF